MKNYSSQRRLETIRGSGINVWVTPLGKGPLPSEVLAEGEGGIDCQWQKGVRTIHYTLITSYEMGLRLCLWNQTLGEFVKQDFC